MTWLTHILNYFRPINPVIQPTHWQSWDISPRRKKK